MKKSVRITIILIILFSLFGSTPTQSVRATTEWVVTNANASGAGSLRQAILDAASGDTITFDPELSGANIYILTGMTLAKDITIDATNLNAPITLDGQEGNRLFQINSGYAVVLRGFVVKNGYYNGSGGTFYKEGTLSISDCNILDSVANGFGGAIFNTGTLNIENCTFLNNHSIQASGGAIANWSGNLTVQNSSFIGNYAGEGGGVRIFNGGAVFGNTTFFSNAPSAIHSTGKLTLRNSTIGGGGSSGVLTYGNYSTGSNTSELHILNSIIANHVDGQDCYNSSSQLLTNIHNLIESGNCGTPLLTEDPLLELPSDNSGPTQTMALLPGSPAIDAGDDATCEETDQRGMTRPQGSQCDIGAFEYIHPPTYVTNANDSGPGSLRQTIANASNGDTITFDPSLAGQTIHLASELEVDKSITIDGSNLDPHITLSGDTDADGDGDVQIMGIGLNGVVKIVNVDFVNGKNEGYILAGGINNFGGSLELENCTFSGNTGDVGGAILNKGNLTVQNCIFNNNSANDGGAILNDIDAVATIADSQFSQNTAPGEYASAGAVGNLGTLTILNSEFIENFATLGGGAVVNGLDTTGETVISNSIFTSNSTDGKGGAIYITEGGFTISDSTFNFNSADLGGGAIYTESPDPLTITGTNFVENSTPSRGGAILLIGNLEHQGSLSIENSTFQKNSGNHGGAIFNFATTLTITESSLTQNHATNDGGAILNANGGGAVTKSTILQNQAGNDGGAIFSLGQLTITSSLIAQNQAGVSGGAVFIAGLTINNLIENSTITENQANYGGAISIGGHAGLSILNNTLVSNQATYGSEVWKFTGSLSDLFFINTIAICASEVNSCIVSTPPLLLGNSIIETGIPESFGLGPLADNGGPTQTMALLPGSPAIDMGNDYYCKDIDQRGVARPQGGQCDIGAFEYLDDIPPDVSAITRANSNPTALPNATFTVAFSEPVTGVDADDFDLFTSGVTGASITGVSGSDDTYTVTVDTGSGNGSIRLDLIDDDTIEDLFGNKLGDTGAGNGTFTSGETYTILKMPVKPVGIPRLSLPRRNAITSDTTPTFNWTNVVNAQGYEIVIATDAAFTQVVLSETVSSPTFTPSVPLGDGRHFWRVRALNSAAQPGRFSLAQAFTIDTTAPNAPTLTSPMDTASLRSTPMFRWMRVPGAVLYEFQYDNDADLSSPTYSALLRTNYRKPPAMPNGTHYWRVRARDAAGNWSEWSPAFTVTISQ